jgi:uncharacterized membrane protein
VQPAESEGHRDEYFVRRLEAFGDVVIGFSLALLALSLFVPKHAAQLIAHADWFVAYVWTFAFVCTMWGQHYWTFRHVFVPNRVSVLLNYAKLGLIVLLIFFVQVLLRAFEMGNAHDVVVGNELYWGCLTAYWVVTALLLAAGMRGRTKPLAPDIERMCVLRFWRLGITVPLVAAGIAIGAAGDPDRMASTIALFLIAGLAIGGIAGRVATRTSERIER